MPRRVTASFVLVGLALAMVSTAFAQVGSQNGNVRLTRVAGSVIVRNNATAAETVGANNQVIQQGNTVITGADGRVILVFSNGATLNLAADSELNIQTFLQDPFADTRPISQWEAEPSVSTTRVFLSRGELVGNVKTLDHDNNSSFTVATPAGAAGIRGTTFRIVYRPQGNGTAFFTLTTLEGDVLVGQEIQGVIDSGVSVTDTEEVVIEVTVDDNTGEVTSITNVTEGAASTEVSAEIAAAAQEIIEETEELVVTDNDGAGNDPANEGNNDNQDEEGDQGQGNDDDDQNQNNGDGNGATNENNQGQNNGQGGENAGNNQGEGTNNQTPGENQNNQNNQNNGTTTPPVTTQVEDASPV